MEVQKKVDIILSTVKNFSFRSVDKKKKASGGPTEEYHDVVETCFLYISFCLISSVESGGSMYVCMYVVERLNGTRTLIDRLYV